MFESFLQLTKISFVPIFLLAMAGVATFFFRSFRRGEPPRDVLVFWAIMFVVMFAARAVFDNSSSRYFASTALWIIIAAAYFCTVPLTMRIRRRSWIDRCLCALLLAGAAVFCIAKTARVASPYSGYIIKLAGDMAEDAKSEKHVLFCARKNLDRYRWYSGIKNAYHVSQLSLADSDDPVALRELVRQFRYYDGTVYVITTNDRKTDLQADEVGLPNDKWRLLSGSFTNRHRTRRRQIYKLSGGDLLRHEPSFKTEYPALANHDFEGAAGKSRFVTAFPHAEAEMGEWPRGWIPYLAKTGRCSIGLKREAMPGRGRSLNWRGHGEFEVYNSALIPGGPLELSFYASGKTDSEYGIVMELFDAQNKFAGKRFLAHLRIGSAAPERIVVSIPPSGSPVDRNVPTYAKFRLGVVYYGGEVNIDDWKLFTDK